MHIYVSANRKLRLQCAAVYCLSWLFSPQLPVPRLPSSSSILLVIGDLLSSDRRRSSFLLGARRGIVTDSSPAVYLGDGNGEDFLFPLVWRGWQFRGVSHRGAASRTNKTLEGRRAEGMGLKKLG